MLVVLGVTILTAVVSASPSAAAGPRPLFQLPFACGQQWVAFTRSDHSPNPNSLDMNRLDGTTNNTQILASYAGTVVRSGWDDGGGWFVRIDHGGGWQTRYLHMIASPAVSVGQQVARGQVLGRVGSTGNSSGPHLHFEQIADGTTVRSHFNGSAVTVEVGRAQNLTSHNCGGSSGGSGSVDGDAFADIVSVYNGGELMWYRNSGSNTFSAARSLGNAPGFRLMSLGDVNGDRRADIVAVYTSGDLVWYQNNGGTFSAARSLGNAPGFKMFSMGDVNGDGRDDMVAVYTSGDLVWYQNNGGTFSAARPLGNAPGFRLMAMGDVNGDGDDDIVSVYTGGQLMWYQNNGGTFSAAKSLGNAPGFRLLSMGDVSGDGNDDIVSVYNSGELMWYLNSGSNTFSSARSLGNAPGFRLMSTA